MNLNTHIKGIRHIADSFCFSDSAGIADIRLDYLNGIIHEIPYVFPSAEHPLPMGQRHFHIILYIFVIVEYRRVRLLKIVILQSWTAADSWIAELELVPA